MALHWLHDGAHAELTPKAAGLARALAAGLPVPPGFAVPLRELGDAAVVPALARLLREGAVIVRSALAHEDGSEHSGAGLGESRGDVVDRAGFDAAVVAITTARAAAGFDDPRDAIVVQRQHPAALRLVVACEDGRDTVEVYGAALDAFGRGDTPDYAGPLRAWAHAAAADVAAVVARAKGLTPTEGFGLDLELVVDGDGGVALVQLRPLTAPLHPDWPTFVAAVEADGGHIPPHGTWMLDAEHNPTPLSPAHCWLVTWLARQRPATGGLLPLAGWLYTRTLVRDLVATTTRAPSEVLRRLHRDHLPAARARLDALQCAAIPHDAAALQQRFDEALAAFLAMIDVYTGELVGARRRRGAQVIDRDDPLCLRGRDDVLDVLPWSWDVAATAIGERRVRAVPPQLPEDDDTAATLLGEWDDHLFALGLRAVTVAYEQAAAALGWPRDDVFALTPVELGQALDPRAQPAMRASIDRRRAALAQRAGLRVPARIVDGQPAVALRRWLRGVGIGEDHQGALAQRRDLEALVRDPPPPGAIVVLPALTAQAAVVLARLGVRAVCCEHGGALGHGALMARELGLSALLGCRGVLAIPDGTPMRLDARRGALRPSPPIR